MNYPATLNVVHTDDGDIASLIAELRMRNDNVLVEFEPAPKRHGVLHLPDTGPRPIDGVWVKVLAVGPGHEPTCQRCGCVRPGTVATGVTVGARALLSSAQAGDRWHVGGREYRVVRAGEILAVCE